jgi:putative transposase
MITREHPLSLTRQCRLLNLSRSGIYYTPVPVSDKDRVLMRLMDEMHLKYPFQGSRGIRNELWDMGYKVGRSHIRTLMKKMGIEAIYKKPRLSAPHPGHKILPLSFERTCGHESWSWFFRQAEAVYKWKAAVLVHPASCSSGRALQ